MKKKIQVIPSGIPLVDLTWGGFYRGGTYFLFGPKKSGRTILALQFVKQAVNDKDTCLYFTTVRPKDLMINAAAIDFDLQHYMSQNSVVLVRVSPPKNIDLSNDPDLYLAEYLKDIRKVVNQYNPSRIIFDELTPFIGFKNLDLLSDTFAETLEPIEDSGRTSLFVLGEPATPAAEKVMDTLLNFTTGYISLEKRGEFIAKSEPGVMTITPNVGHTEGRFSADYYIEAYSGVNIDYFPLKSTGSARSFTKQNDYIKLSELELKEKTFEPVNFYSVDDFKLILNNQIAFYKSTGQVFTLVSIRLDEEAERKNLLTINQLQNAIRLSVDKKDKICLLHNKVLVLFTKEEKEISNFIAQTIRNLPDSSPRYLNAVTRFISVYSVIVTEKTINADGMFEQLIAANVYGKENPRVY